METVPIIIYIGLPVTVLHFTPVKTMVQMLFALFVLGSVATIPPAAGYALQDYCSGPLMTSCPCNDTTVVRISSGLLCNISNGSYIAITGSSNTIVRCEGEGAVFEFMSAQQLTMAVADPGGGGGGGGGGHQGHVPPPPLPDDH